MSFRLRSFLNWCSEMGGLSFLARTMERLLRVPNVEVNKPYVTAPSAEIERVLDVASLRDKALVLVMARGVPPQRLAFTLGPFPFADLHGLRDLLLSIRWNSVLDPLVHAGPSTRRGHHRPQFFEGHLKTVHLRLQ